MNFNRKTKKSFLFIIFFLPFFLQTVFSTITHNSEYLIVPENEFYILDGTHTFSNSVHIYGTLYVSSYCSTNKNSGTIEIITPNLTIYQNGKVVATGKGHSGGMGVGAGVCNSRYNSGERGGSGGGYGGYGGKSYYGSTRDLAFGGISYGSEVEPEEFGSGGGGYGNVVGQFSGYYGGNGGGKIKMVVGNKLVVNGDIECNGEDGKIFT